MRPFLIVLVALAGCTAAPLSAPPGRGTDSFPGPVAFGSEAQYQEQRTAAVAALRAAARSTPASAPGACRTAGVGERPCGGPFEYVVYSAEAADTLRVAGWAEHVYRLDSLANARFGYASTCEFRGPPPVVLRNGECVAGQ